MRDKNIPQALDALRHYRAMTNELADSRLFESELCPRHRLVVYSDQCGMQLASRWGGSIGGWLTCIVFELCE